MSAQTAAQVERHAWNELARHYESIRDVHMRELFAEDPDRGKRLTAEAVGTFLRVG